MAEAAAVEITRLQDIPLDNQSVELAVSACLLIYSRHNYYYLHVDSEKISSLFFVVAFKGRLCWYYYSCSSKSEPNTI